MKLTPEQHKKLTEHVGAQWKPPYQCPYCKANNWNITQEVFQLTVFAGGDMVVGGPVVPLAPVTCNRCGHTVLINAIIAGVVEPKKEEGKSDGK